jgi:hypothetical protein
MNYLIGILEDNLILIYFGKYLRLYGNDFANKLTSPYPVLFDIEKGTEYPFFAFYFWLSRYIDAFTLYNFFVLCSLLLTAVFFYKLISYFLELKIIKFFLTLVFIISPYFSYQYRSHPTLMLVWILLISMSVVVKPVSRKTLLFSLTVLILSVLSNYLAYFALIFYSLYTISYLIFNFVQNRGITADFKNVVKYYFLNSLIFITFALLVFLPKISGSHNSDASDAYIVPVRTVEDFFTFTSRPWYYFLPSVDNPFYGSITRSIISFLQNDWGYFLTSNYFKSEHSASFMGLINIISGIVGLVTIVRYKNKQSLKPVLIALFSTGILIALLTMPPFITIGGIKIYMPSYIAFLVFPMFRVLVRLGVVNMAILLIFTGIGYEYLVRVLQNKGVHAKYFGYSLLLIIGALSISELWVPIKLTHKSAPPDIFRQLGELPNEGSLIVYPENMSNYALIWHEVHKKPTFHLRARMDVPKNFQSKSVVENLNTEAGLEQAKLLGVKYLVVFDNESTVFFDNSSRLKKTSSFPAVLSKTNNANSYKWLVNVEEIGPRVKADLYIIQ